MPVKLYGMLLVIKPLHILSSFLLLFESYLKNNKDNFLISSFDFTANLSDTFQWVFVAAVALILITNYTILNLYLRRKMESKVPVALYKFLHVSFATYGILPFYQVAIGVFYCSVSQGDTCPGLNYSPFMIFVSLWGVLGMLCFRIFNEQFFIVTNIRERGTSSRLKLSLSLFGPVSELTFCLFFTLFRYEKTRFFGNWILILLIILYTLRLRELITTKEYLNSQLQSLEKYIHSILLAVSLSSFIVMASNSSDITSIYLIVLILSLLIPMIMSIRSYQMIREDYLLSTRFCKLSPGDAKRMIELVVDLIKKKKDNFEKKNNMLKDFVSYHLKELSTVGYDLTTARNKNIGNGDFLIDSLFKISLKTNPRSTVLLVSYSLFKLYRFDDTWGCLECMRKARSLNLSVVERYLAKKIHYELEKKIKIPNRNQILLAESFIKYERDTVEMKMHMRKSSKVYKNFWRELKKEEPEPKKLVVIANKLSKIARKISGIYNSLDVERNTLKMSSLYYDYSLYILNEEETEFCKFIQKVVRIRGEDNPSDDMKKFVRTLELGIRKDNFLDCLLRVGISNNFELGAIIDSYGDTQELLGYEGELIDGKRLIELIPEFLRERHFETVQGFFSSKKVNPGLPKRSAWILDRCGYLRLIDIQIFPNHDLTSKSGLEFFVYFSSLDRKKESKKRKFFDKNRQSFDIVLSYDDGRILGLTHNCSKGYGLSPSMFKKQVQNPLYIESIVKEIRDVQDLDNLKAYSLDTIEITIDTTNVPEIFPFIETGPINSSKNSGIVEERASSYADSDELYQEEVKQDEKEMMYQKRYKKERVTASFERLNCLGKELIHLKFCPSANLTQKNIVSFEEETQEVLLSSEEGPTGGVSPTKSTKGRSKNSMMEIKEKKRIVHEEVMRLKQETNPIELSYIRWYMFWILVIFALLFTVEFFIKEHYEDRLKTAVQYYISIEKRGYLISNTGFLSLKIYLLTKYNDRDFGGTQVAKIKQELEDLANQLNALELRASNARFFYEEFEKDSTPFLTDQGDYIEHKIFKYISSLSSLVTNSDKPGYFESSAYQFIEDHYLRKLRVTEKRVEQAYQNFLQDLVDWAIKIRYNFCLFEQIYRLFAAIFCMVVISISLDFDQLGLKTLSMMDFGTIEKIQGKIKKFDKKYWDEDEAQFAKELHEEDTGSKDIKDVKSVTEGGSQESKNEKKRPSNKANLRKKMNLFSRKDKKGSGSYGVVKSSSKIREKGKTADFEERRELLKINQSGRKKIVILTVIPIAGYFVLMGFGIYFFEKIVIQNTGLLVNKIHYVGQAPKILGYCVNFLYKDLSNGAKEFTSPDGEFQKLTESGYQKIKEINQFDNFPFNSQKFQEKYQKIFKLNLCESLKSKEYVEECRDYPILDKSLYMVSVYILETLRKYAYFDKMTVEEGVDLIDSQEMVELGKTHSLIFEDKVRKVALAGYEEMVDELDETVDDVYSFTRMIRVATLLAWYILIPVCYIVAEVFITQSVKEILFEDRRVFALIPVSVIRGNERIIKVLLKNKKLAMKGKRRR